MYSNKITDGKTFTDAVQKAIFNTRYSVDPVDPHPGRLMMKTRVAVKKWYSEADKNSGKAPYEVKIDEGNVGLSLGITRLISLMTLSGTSGGLVWNNANTCIGVATSATAAVAANYGLNATAATSATAQEFHKMDATTYPAVSGSNLIVRSTFGATEANFAWNEFIIKNATYNTDCTAGVALIRKISAQGTKISGQSWEATITVTVS